MVPLQWHKFALTCILVMLVSHDPEISLHRACDSSFNLLSLLFHTLLELLDDKHRLLRQHLASRKTFFDDLRALTRY
jgi:hypothetical protein